MNDCVSQSLGSKWAEFISVAGGWGRQWAARLDILSIVIDCFSHLLSPHYGVSGLQGVPITFSNSSIISNNIGYLLVWVRSRWPAITHKCFSKSQTLPCLQLILKGRMSRWKKQQQQTTTTNNNNNNNNNNNTISVPVLPRLQKSPQLHLESVQN